MKAGGVNILCIGAAVFIGGIMYDGDADGAGAGGHCL